jgi:hypothetical protein
MRKSRTYFKQIPLEVVKKIATEELSGEEQAATGNGRVEPVSSKSARRWPARSLDGKRR